MVDIFSFNFPVYLIETFDNVIKNSALQKHTKVDNSRLNLGDLTEILPLFEWRCDPNCNMKHCNLSVSCRLHMTQHRRVFTHGDVSCKTRNHPKPAKPPTNHPNHPQTIQTTHTPSTNQPNQSHTSQKPPKPPTKRAKLPTNQLQTSQTTHKVPKNTQLWAENQFFMLPKTSATIQNMC